MPKHKASYDLYQSPGDAEALAKALGGRKVGGSWMARCPVHDDRRPSLSIEDGLDGKVLVYCHAGCDQMRVIAELRRRGLWDGDKGSRWHHGQWQKCAASETRHLQEVKRSEAALSIWNATEKAEGSLAQTYLQSRGLHLPLPATLRFHKALRHPSGIILPTMVAIVTRAIDDAPIAIHRTFLARDGSGKAPVEPQRMMLGPCRGGAVRLGVLGRALMIGEGIETCLSAMQATGIPALAALSTSGLRALTLPTEVRDVIVLADGDDAGEAAARECASRFSREGRRVRIARPPTGLDFNDLLVGRMPHSNGSVA